MTKLEDILQTQAVQAERLKNIENTCNDIKECVQGTPENIGLGTRVFVLEGKSKLAAKIVWMLTAGVTMMVLSTVMQYFGWKR